MKLNPTAIAFWIFCTSLGFAIIGTAQAAAIGLTFATGLSVAWDFWDK